MKKIITALLAVLLILGLSGCELFRLGQSPESFAQIVADFESSVDKLPHYYLMLNDTEKAAYASIVTTINSSGDVALVPRIDDASLEAVTQAVSYDNPHFLWLSKEWVVTNYITGRAKAEIPYLLPANKRKQMVDELERKAEQILSGINPAMGDYEKELYLHDYLVKNCRYDSSALSYDEFTNVYNAYTAYGALVEGRAVCEGYARAMQFLLSKAGVESYVLTGESLDQSGIRAKHMWNVVKIDSWWYHLDATWNDPISSTNFSSVRHSYFNLTDEDIRRDHFYDDATDCTATKANYYRKNSLYFTSFSSTALANKLSDELYKAKRTNQDFIELKFENKDDFENARHAIMNQSLVHTAMSIASSKYGIKISSSAIYCSTNNTQLVIGINF